MYVITRSLSKSKVLPISIIADRARNLGHPLCLEKLTTKELHTFVYWAENFP